ECARRMTSQVAVVVLLSRGPATTGLYARSLHDALPIFSVLLAGSLLGLSACPSTLSHTSARTLDKGQREATLSLGTFSSRHTFLDRKSTRLNSSHVTTSYAVFCSKKIKPTYNCI